MLEKIWVGDGTRVNLSLVDLGADDVFSRQQRPQARKD